MSLVAVHDLARALSRDAFASRFKSLFLAVIGRGDDEAPVSFETVDAASVPRALLDAPSAVEVHEIAKAKNSPYQDRISVGRAPNCDVVLRYASVSKLHGYFHRRPDGALELIDVDSQVGTRVNGRALVANTPEIVKVGAVILLGRIMTKLVDAGAVWDLVKAEERLGASGPGIG